MYNMFGLKSKKNKSMLNSRGVTGFFSLFIYLCFYTVPRLDKLINTIKVLFTAGFSIQIFCLEKIRGWAWANILLGCLYAAHCQPV